MFTSLFFEQIISKRIPTVRGMFLLAVFSMLITKENLHSSVYRLTVIVRRVSYLPAPVGCDSPSLLSFVAPTVTPASCW